MRKLMDTLCVIGIVALIIHRIFVWHYSRPLPEEEIEAHFKPITSKYGIRIVYEISDDFFSPIKNPLIPAGPPRHSTIKPIHHRVLIRYPGILHKAFSKYPVEVIKNYLKAIYFAGDIDIEGSKAAGTYDPFRSIIYLVDDDSNSDDFSIYTFHHEFSSLLMKSHSFWVDPWTDHHPKNFQYICDIYDNWEEVDKACKKITDEDCYKIGIVTNYGLTNFGNDFSEYSAMILTYPEKFKKIMDQYPRVRGKFLVWLEFYHKIDPIFTEAYLFGNSSN